MWNRDVSRCLVSWIAVSLLVATPGVLAQGDGAPDMNIEEVKPGLYMVSGGGGATGVVATEDGLILVDSKNRGDQFYSALMAQIRTVSDQPVRYVFITHHHQDHSGNIQNFLADGAQVIAHEDLGTYSLNRYYGDERFPDGRSVAPNVTYRDRVDVRLGNVEAHAHYFGPSHTGADSVVHFPGLGVIFTGDIVGNQPGVDYPFGGSAVGMFEVANGMLSLEFDVAVTGHGGVVPRSEIEDFQTRMGTLVSRGIDAVRRGVPKEELLSEIRSDAIGFDITSETWADRLDLLYVELLRIAR